MPDRREAALTYLKSHHVMSLATTGPGGPWSAAVFYVSEGFELTFLSSPSTRHATDLAADPRGAATIHEDYSDWPDIRGLQLEGRVQRLKGKDRMVAITGYTHKFPVARSDRAPELIRAALERVAWYRLVPDRCYFIDNSQGFGHRDEIPLP